MLLRDYIFCDDVRFEMGNKVSLMGLYSDRIVFEFPADNTPKWPQPIKLCVCLRVEFEKDDERPNEANFKTLIDGVATPVNVTTQLKIDQNQSVYNVLILMQGIQMKPGQLGFEFVLRKDGKDIYRKEISSALKIEEKRTTH